jgi:hypothetical protein
MVLLIWQVFLSALIKESEETADIGKAALPVRMDAGSLCYFTPQRVATVGGETVPGHDLEASLDARRAM